MLTDEQLAILRDIDNAVAFDDDASAMELVLEGVETVADAETLGMLGCRIGQGWLYGKAMPEADVLTWLDRRHARAKAVA